MTSKPVVPPEMDGLCPSLVHKIHTNARSVLSRRTLLSLIMECKQCTKLLGCVHCITPPCHPALLYCIFTIKRSIRSEMPPSELYGVVAREMRHYPRCCCEVPVVYLCPPCRRCPSRDRTRSINEMYHPVFVCQVVQLEELLAVRHSVFMIGNAGTGKSQVMRSLHRTYQNTKRRPVWADLNPKAVTNDELFGIINPATREWKDGD